MGGGGVENCQSWRNIIHGWPLWTNYFIVLSKKVHVLFKLLLAVVPGIQILRDIFLVYVDKQIMWKVDTLMFSNYCSLHKCLMPLLICNNR